MSAVKNLTPDEKRAYDLITSGETILQSELWKELDASSRKGSRLATSLEEKGLIEREETVSDGRTTYLLHPTNGERTRTAGQSDDSVAVSAFEDDGGRDIREERALSLIRAHSGIHQSELWKALDVSSRTGSRIASRLEGEGLIRREETTHDGRRTYLLRPAENSPDFTLLMAGDEISPLIGAGGELDPIDSPEFSQWVLRLLRERE